MYIYASVWKTESNSFRRKDKFSGSSAIGIVDSK